MAVAAKKKTTKKVATGKKDLMKDLTLLNRLAGIKVADELLQDAEKAVPHGWWPCLSESNDDQATQAFFALEAMVMSALNPGMPI